MRARAASLLLLGLAPAAPAEEPRTIVGSADVKIVGEGRGSARIVFAASAQPPALRLEVVGSGGVEAVLYCDAERLLVLVPGATPLLHVGEPTREGFEAALDFPFCLDELLFALRVGHAPAPACGRVESVPVLGRGGRIVGLSREGGGGRPELLRFSRFNLGPEGNWPARAVLERPGSVATLLFGALRIHERPPLDLDPQLVARALRVEAPELRRSLGLSPQASP